MKILILMPLAEQRGGGELTLLHLMQQGQDQGVDWCIVFQEQGPMVEQVRNLGVPAWVIPSGRMRQAHLIALSIMRISALARREKVDAIFSWMTKPHLYGSFAARLAGVPALWFQHGMPSSRSRLDKIATALPAAAIFACSKAAADGQERIKPKRPMHVVHPGVDLDRFDPMILPNPAAARRRLGLPNEGALIGIVGRLQRWKGIHVLIEAMPKVLERHPDAHCIVVGGEHDLEADYSKLVAKSINDHQLQDCIIMAGLQRNVPEWMQAMDIFVHASDREPFGIVIIEAMALGKPVIAGDAGGPTEIIQDGVNGLLSPYGDAEKLADAMIKYLDDPSFAASMGHAAQARAQEFSTARYAANFINALQSILKHSDREAAHTERLAQRPSRG